MIAGQMDDQPQTAQPPLLEQMALRLPQASASSLDTVVARRPVLRSLESRRQGQPPVVFFITARRAFQRVQKRAVA